MFSREFVITPAFDRRSSDPKKNYGIHGCELRFYLKGPKGAVQFVIYSQWHLPHVQKELIGKCNPITPYGRHCSLEPMAADIGYHSPVPMYDGQEPMSDNCSLLGGKCYYDGSSLNAERYFEIMVREGHEGLWKAMESYYHNRFGTDPDARAGQGESTGSASANTPNMQLAEPVVE